MLNIPPPRGQLAARYLRALIIGKNDPVQAAAFAAGQGWPHSDRILAAIRAPMDALDTAHAAALLAPVGNDFTEVTRPLSILGRLTGVRRVPFRTRLIGMTSGAQAAWVGESNPKALSAAAFLEGATLEPRKAVAHSVVSTELARLADPKAERLLLADLARATAEAVDLAVFDPANNGAGDTRPASITYGGPTIASSGSSLAAADADLNAAIRALVEAGSTLEAGTWVTTPKTAAALAALRGTGGAPAFPNISALGGTLLGMPVVTGGSLAAPSSPTESTIVLLDQDAILLADDNEAILSVGRHASLQMTDSPESGETQLVGLWQNNLVALRAERFIAWARRRDGAAVSITGIQY